MVRTLPPCRTESSFRTRCRKQMVRMTGGTTYSISAASTCCSLLLIYLSDSEFAPVHAFYAPDSSLHLFCSSTEFASYEPSHPNSQTIPVNSAPAVAVQQKPPTLSCCTYYETPRPTNSSRSLAIDSFDYYVSTKLMEVSESCTLCGKPNDQMLMLACVHDPCINCAASTYAQQIHIKGQSKELYFCEVCNEETLLDNSTIAELTALASSVLKIPTKSVKTGTRKKQTQSTPLTQSTSQAPLKKVIYYCKEHGEEEISYYCFRCWLNICPECAIHGEHKEHEVKLIKKAISEVKSQYQALVSQTGQSQATMTRLKDQFLRLIKETNDRHSRERNLVSRQFQQLRNQLQNKEKQLLRELEELNRTNVATLTAFLQAINSSYEEGNKVKRTIEYIGKKDQVLVLEDFKRIGELQEKLQTLSRVSETLSGQSLLLNTELLQQVMNQTADSLNTVKMSVKREPINSMEILATPLRGGHT